MIVCEVCGCRAVKGYRTCRSYPCEREMVRRQEQRDKEWLPSPCEVCGAMKPSKFHMCPNTAAHGKPKYEYLSPCLICGTMKSEKFLLCDDRDCSWGYAKLSVEERAKRCTEAKAKRVMKDTYPDAKKFISAEVPKPEVPKRCKNCSFFKDEWCQKWNEHVYMEEGACGEFEAKTQETDKLVGLNGMIQNESLTDWWRSYEAQVQRYREQIQKDLLQRSLFGSS